MVASGMEYRLLTATPRVLNEPSGRDVHYGRSQHFGGKVVIVAQ